MRLAVLLPLLMPAGAHAATVSVRQGVPVTLSDELSYVAGPGEANALRVVFAADDSRIMVSDPGATIAAGVSCTSIDEHTAVCIPRPVFSSFLFRANAQLGDLDDSLEVEAANSRERVTVDGGRGDDTLRAGPGQDSLNGGGGRDVLDAGPGDDQLTDGDLEGAPEGSGPDIDRLDGGKGIDTVSYAKRTRRVRLDLSASPASGAEEGDIVSGVEGVQGGAGPDVLAGGTGLTYLNGNAGPDILTDLGRDPGPGDVIVGGSGDDQLTGGAGSDYLAGEGGTDAVSCGAGADLAVNPALPEPIADDCEKLSLRAGDGTYRLLAHPVKSSTRSVTFSVRCPGYAPAGATGSQERVPPCRGTFVLREAGNLERRLGRARIDHRGIAFFDARVLLNRVGRRLTGRPNGVTLKASLGGGRTLPAAAWSVRVRR